MASRGRGGYTPRTRGTPYRGRGARGARGSGLATGNLAQRGKKRGNEEASGTGTGSGGYGVSVSKRGFR